MKINCFFFNYSSSSPQRQVISRTITTMNNKASVKPPTQLSLPRTSASAPTITAPAPTTEPTRQSKVVFTVHRRNVTRSTATVQDKHESELDQSEPVLNETEPNKNGDSNAGVNLVDLKTSLGKLKCDIISIKET